MFAQFMIYVFIILLIIWLTWRMIIIPILKEKGIEIDEPQTDYTKKLERLKEEYRLMETSTQAAEEGVEMMKQIREMERKIRDADERMRDI